MSNRTSGSIRGMLRSGRLDVIGGVLILIVALGLLPLQLIASQVYIRTLPIVLGTAAVLYLVATRTDYRSERLPVLAPSAAGLLPAVTVVGMAVLVAVATLQGQRTLAFYLMSASLAVLLLVQVLFTSEEDFSPALLLGQVVLLGVVIRGSALLTTPGYVGIDVWSHVPSWSAAILEARSLQPIANNKYYASPLFHLLVVGSSLLFDMPIREALFLTMGVAMPVSVLFVYATTRLLIDTRWAVFAATVYSLSGHVIEWGIHLIPTSLGLIFFLGVLYSLLRVLHFDYRTRDFVPVVFFSVAVILTHQISAFIMLVFTGAGLIAQILLSIGLFNPRLSKPFTLNPKETVNLSGLLVFDLGLITFMWSLTPYQGGTFLTTILSYLRSTIESSAGFLNLAGQPPSSGGGGSASAGPTLMDQVVAYLDVGAFLLLLLLTVVGSIAVLRRENTSHATYTSVLATVFMLVFVFVLPLFGIRTFVPGRWFAFLVAPMAIIGAIGLRFLTNRLSARTAATVLVVFVVAFPTVSLLASHGTLESPPFVHSQTRYGYHEPELAAVDTLSDITATSETRALYMDHPYGTVFERYADTNAEVAVVSNGTVSTANETMVYRTYQSSGAAYLRSDSGYAFTPQLTRDEACSGARDLTYDNGAVSMCTAVNADDGGGD